MASKLSAEQEAVIKLLREKAKYNNTPPLVTVYLEHNKATIIYQGLDRQVSRSVLVSTVRHLVEADILRRDDRPWDANKGMAHYRLYNETD